MPLSPRVPELTALDLLLSVARTGSLGAAAREHHISQQAASERIRRLEGTLGVQVLRRSRQGSTLTTAGALVADWAGQLTELAAGLEASVAALRAEHHARLRVAASLTVAEYLMPRWLVTLRHQVEARHDELSVQLTATNSEEVAERVRDGRAGLGFVEGPAAPDDLAWREIGTDSLVLVVPTGHPWSRRRRPVGAAELAATPLVSREAGSGTRRALEVALEAVGHVGIEPLLELSGTAAVRGAVLAGAGPAMLSTLAVADDVASGRLRTVAVTGLALDRRLLAVWSLGSSPRGPASDLLTIALRGRSQR
ncbi:LysR family transcriptional regulator [Kineosporia sp. NBRC 101731]|uniref:LysR family transcriptional regulator n=1 Tax=Kineosporia sp. NBRC 101731 TaxID=3032199 RepID=UPI0024A06651|nr:LysR family transcriptional regulator [Kineosporia sp. NBRC 101731]GLY27632.1 LysR family transcriptional regulator [Kineosporia sp. NBRC 101731]